MKNAENIRLVSQWLHLSKMREGVCTVEDGKGNPVAKVYIQHSPNGETGIRIDWTVTE